MSHGITVDDSLLLYRDPAWHGIGEIVSAELSPTQALVKARLDWEVVAVRPHWSFGGVTASARTAQTVLRVPRPGAVNRVGEPERVTELGTVGPEWKAIQNREMFALAEAGAGLGVRVESAGSLNGGRVVFALLRADAFLVGDADQVHKYLLLVMSHTGKITLRAVPVSIRVCCTNTLRMALNRAGFFSIRHTGDIQGKLTEMAKAVRFFKMTGTAFEERALALHSRKMRSADLEEYFRRAWVALHSDAGTGRPPREKEKAREVLADWLTGMELEQMELGEKEPTLWLAMNSVTRWIQHRAPGKSLPDLTAAADTRLRKNLVGWNDRDSVAMLRLASTF